MTKDRYTNLVVEDIHGVKPILIHWQLLSTDSEMYKRYAKDFINENVISEFAELTKNCVIQINRPPEKNAKA
jgi:hypothetical protein